MKEEKTSRRQRIKSWFARIWQSLLPSPSVRKGAAIAILGVIVILAAAFGFFLTPGLPIILDNLVGILYFLLMGGLFLLLFALALQLIKILPKFLNTLGMLAWIVLIFLLSDFAFPPPWNFLLGIVIGLTAAFFGGGLARIFNPEFKYARPLKKVYTVLCLVLPLAFLTYIIVWLAGRGSMDHLADIPTVSQQVPALTAPNPSRPGSYTIKSLTYGSGKNKRRPEFGADAQLITQSVDAMPFVKNNKGWRIKLRHWYWGFDFKEFPVNGTVWYPDGDGPFPLVLIVHGNHKMQEYSDPGYAYLGELMASRGFIFISVDENFFNGAFMSGLSRENDGRGWMLLQHLKVWREWNQDPSNPFYGKVDMENIGLIGHSRGGEAAAIAGALNRLSYYPDDATITFDFDFNIRAIIAIAPSDGQYKPAGQPTPLENVNYMVLHGAHDADVSVFTGDRQYNRVAFTDDNYWFKTSIYSYRCNHGQFNTVWGDSDWGKPMGILLNRKALLSGEQQRTISKVYISAFLETTLKGNLTYLPLFQDFRTIADWLPEDIYINRFQDSSFQVICDFDEDVDVTTATLPGAKAYMHDLALWKEADLKTRGARFTKQNNVVCLGWRGSAEERTGETAPFYAVDLPEDFATTFQITAETLLVFNLADANESLPDPEEDEEKENEEDKVKEEKTKEEKKQEQEVKKKPIEISIELVDASGASVRLPLDHFKSIPPMTKSRFTKIPNEGDRFGSAYEPTLQSFDLPLKEFLEQSIDFDITQLRTIRFVFDRGREGSLFLDNLGFAQPNGQTDTLIQN